MAGQMDLKPAQVMHSIRLTARMSCSTARPSGCAWVARRARRAARNRSNRRSDECRAHPGTAGGTSPAFKEVGIYYNAFVTSMWLNGKIHDISVVALTRLLNGTIIHDLPLALVVGRPWAHEAAADSGARWRLPQTRTAAPRSRRQYRMRYGYYPGCSLESISAEYDHSMRASGALGRADRGPEGLDLLWDGGGGIDVAPDRVGDPAMERGAGQEDGFRPAHRAVQRLCLPLQARGQEGRGGSRPTGRDRGILEMPLDDAPPTIHPLELLTVTPLRRGSRRCPGPRPLRSQGRKLLRLSRLSPRQGDAVR